MERSPALAADLSTRKVNVLSLHLDREIEYVSFSTKVKPILMIPFLLFGNMTTAFPFPRANDFVGGY